MRYRNSGLHNLLLRIRQRPLPSIIIALVVIVSVYLFVSGLNVLIAAKPKLRPGPPRTFKPLEHSVIAPTSKSCTSTLELLKSLNEADELEKAVDILKSTLLPVLPRLEVPDGKKYLTCTFTVTRNEYWLTEFIVRNLLAGVDHMWIADDNRVGGCLDMNITRLVRPFVELGLVDVVRLDQSGGGQSIKEGQKQEYLKKMFELGQPLCRWGSVIDSDEVWYPLDNRYGESLSKIHIGKMELADLEMHYLDRSGIGQLPHVLERIQSQYEAYEGEKLAALIWGWSETDNEHALLRSTKSLLETFPKTCYSNFNHKVWAVMDRVNSLMDHTMDPSDPGYKRMVFEDGEHMLMIHYQMRSVEEYLLKIDQAFAEWKRSLTTAHKKCNSLTRSSYGKLQDARGPSIPIPYSEAYRSTVGNILGSWPIDTSSTYLAPTFHRTVAYGGTADWELYMFFKWAVASRYEWAENLYLQTNKNVDLELYDDGLHHFLSYGFYHNATACFTAAGRDFCVEKP
jgi:hypothetical protein